MKAQPESVGEQSKKDFIKETRDSPQPFESEQTDPALFGNASNRNWGFSECFVCGKLVSTCGLGYVSHMRKHVREGKVEEHWSSDLKTKEFEFTKAWLSARVILDSELHSIPSEPGSGA